MKVDNILQLIGSTPHLRINRLFENGIEVWIKLEKANPGGSIKDRIALSMIEDAEKRGVLQPGGKIIEPTSGNTGIGLAMVAAIKGYKAVLVMPESMSIERRRLMTAYGAEIVLTPREKGMSGSIEKAKQMIAEDSSAWMPQQFENPANIDIHYKATALEIARDFPDGIDYFVTGVGTGGHITGIARYLKEKFPALKVYAVEPEESPVLSGGQAGPHSIQGIGAGFIPLNYDKSCIDGLIRISKSEAFLYCSRLAKKEGLLAGISTGASLAAIGKMKGDFKKGSRILTVNYDTGERYVSIDELFV